MKAHIRLSFIFAATLLLVTVAVGPALASPGDPVHINEIRIDQPSTDIDEYFELAGNAGSSLDGLTYLVIGDGSGASGVIENVTDLFGNSIPASGYFVAAESTFALGTADLVASLNFENSDNVTHLLVSDFSGANGDDLDTDDDGSLDATPWSAIVDSVALVETVGSGEKVYSATTVGPDGSFVPGQVLHCPGTPPHDWAVGNFFGGDDSPGAANTACPAPPTPLTIMEIQGSGQFSSFDGDFVVTTGVVTLESNFGRDFWLQDPAGDGDPSTSDGIMVDDGLLLPGAHTIGDFVRVFAEAEEQQFGNALPFTRLDDPVFVEVLSSGNPLPAPILLDDLPDATRTEGIDFWEPLEGMRVEVINGQVTAPTNQFGEFGMVTENDAQPGSGYFSEVSQLLLNDLGGNVVDYNPERIQVDDSAVNTPTVRPGDEIGHLVGVVDYTFSMYKLQIGTIEGVVTNPLPTTPVSTRTGEPGNVVITTYNIENLFDLDDSPGKNDIGTGGAPNLAALETQLTKLALSIQVELQLPEIIVVQEAENEEILEDLAERVNLAAGTDYEAKSFETSDGRGIEVGFLYDELRVDFVEAFQLSGPDIDAAFGPASPSPGRQPLVGVFRIEGQEVTIIGNHFKSKGGDDPPYGVSFNRITEIQRKAQAAAVRNFVNTILDADPSALVMVTGDLNDFQFGEPGEGADHPVGILENGGAVPLTNLLSLEVPAETFTFIFDGNSQVLDHMLVSPALLELVVGADILHFNAEFPASLNNDPTTALRASDHDALEGRFFFEPEVE